MDCCSVGYTEDRQFIVFTSPAVEYRFPVQEVPGIVESLRLAARREWTTACDLRAYPHDEDRVGLTDGVKVTRLGRFVKIEREQIYTVPRYDAFRLADSIERAHSFLTRKLN